ncbi:galactose-1-phosphate uridylyltransferase [Williamsia phyllosphaerae]|uniref:Galactose-1-phosphate uridylyltransferase n=1 Tax=Williamsia phyllosphaerae TaxID=885042 RepID=A0ABQ1V0C1_9NOCA|nr:galactose-1-phosphate uridylyltransferase [Williamsia phyllosphaerae]GGF32853.1 galactose-1-phosphate uridylyltransferase [Williamsia phyllosphaerae]
MRETDGPEPVRASLADGREILFFALPGHQPDPRPDIRPLPDRAQLASEVRFDRATGDWVAVAALRQDRTYKPPADQCPLCPSATGAVSEVPAADYDVVVFENRFPSLSGARPDSDFVLPQPLDGQPVAADGYGRCEVISFSSDHDASFASLNHAHARLVVDAWRHRTRSLLALPEVAQVFCFENRGEDIGVTLTHPHGQIYAYPYLTPRTRSMLDRADAHRRDHDTNLFADILASERSQISRIVTGDELTTAFVPFAARWPVEVHIYPNRQVNNLTDLDDDELDSLTAVYLDVLTRFDSLYPTQLPYISALHQYSSDPAQQEGFFHIELMSVRRSATKLKFLAGSESAMDAFITDVTPESIAARLRDVDPASRR